MMNASTSSAESVHATKCIARLDHVRKSYPSAQGREDLVILDDIDLVIEPGQAISIVGPSGSGKSTLLNILGGLDLPTSGSVYFRDTDLTTLTPRQSAEFRNRSIGFVFQMQHLLPQCTALENVLIPTLVRRDVHDRRQLQDRAMSLLASVGLKERAGHFPAQLSGGECQRVALVRALINDPDLLLADEPTGSVDPSSAAQLADLLEALRTEHGVALVVVTHSTALACRLGTTCELKNGRLTAPAMTS